MSGHADVNIISAVVRSSTVRRISNLPMVVYGTSGDNDHPTIVCNLLISADFCMTPVAIFVAVTGGTTQQTNCRQNAHDDADDGLHW